MMTRCVRGHLASTRHPCKKCLADHAPQFVANSSMWHCHDPEHGYHAIVRGRDQVPWQAKDMDGTPVFCEPAAHPWNAIEHLWGRG